MDPNSPPTDPWQPQQIPNGPLMDPWWTPEELQLLWTVSSNSISKWALQCLFTFCNITILGCNSNYSTLYSMLLLDTNVYNDSYLTSYYQWLEPGNGSSSCCHWLYPASITILDCNSNQLALYDILSLIPMSTINHIWHPTTIGWNQWMVVVVRW